MSIFVLLLSIFFNLSCLYFYYTMLASRVNPLSPRKIFQMFKREKKTCSVAWYNHT